MGSLDGKNRDCSRPSLSNNVKEAAKSTGHFAKKLATRWHCQPAILRMPGEEQQIYPKKLSSILFKR